MPRVKITKAPTGSQADYGLVRKNTVTQSGDSDRKVKNTMTALKGEEKAKANIEVEGGETVLGDINRDGYVELFEFKGKRHAQGGMDVDIPEGSFIFSDTKKLKIKDKEMLKQYFGLSSKRGGYTPAEISKKFQINEFIDTLKNPESDEMAKRSANEMIKNNMQKLGLLAFVQESIKGFPDGVPDIAQMALQELGIDANQMLQEVAPQQQSQMPPQQEMMNQEQIPMAMYGKQVKYPHGGDLPTGDQNKENFDKYYHHLYDRLNKVYGQDFLKSKPPGVDQDTYNLISNLLVWQDDRVIPNDPKMGQMVAVIKNARMLPDDEIKTILSYNISQPLDVGDKFSLWRKLSGDTVDRFEDFKSYVEGAKKQGYTFQDGGENPLSKFLPKAQDGIDGAKLNAEGNYEWVNENGQTMVTTPPRPLGYEGERVFNPYNLPIDWNYNNPSTSDENWIMENDVIKDFVSTNSKPKLNSKTGNYEFIDMYGNTRVVAPPEQLGYEGEEVFNPYNLPIDGFHRHGGMIHPLSKFVGGGQLPQYQVGGEKGRKAKKGDVFYINNEPYTVTSRYNNNLTGFEWVTFDKPLKGIATGSWFGGDKYNDTDIDYMEASEFDRMIQSAQSGTNTFQMGYDKGSFGIGDRFTPVEELSFWDRQGSDLGGLLATFTGDLFTPNEYNYGSGTMFWTLSDKPIEGANFDKYGINESKETVDIEMDGEKKSIKTEYLKPGYKVTKDNVEYVVAGEEGEGALAFDENRGWMGGSGEGRQIRLKQVDDPNWPGIFNATYDIGEGESFLAVDLDEYLREWVEDGQGSASYMNDDKSSGEYVQIGNKSYYRTEGTTDSFYWYNGDVKVTLSDPATVKKVKEAFAEKDKATVKGNTASSTTTKKKSPATTTKVTPSKKRGPITITYD